MRALRLAVLPPLVPASLAAQPPTSTDESASRAAVRGQAHGLQRTSVM